MRKLFVAAVFAALALSSCGVGGGKIKTELDSVAYAIGVDVGHQFRMLDSTMNPKIIAQGMIDAFNQKTDLSRDSVGKYLNEYFFVKVPERRKQEGIDFLEKVKNENKNVVETESGLIYEIIRPGDEEIKPESDRDRVKVMYVGTKVSGHEFERSQDTTEFRLNGVMKGWSEGLKYIGKGGKIKLYIPTELAYGSYGRRPVVEGNEALVFEIELLDVIPYDSTQVEPVQPPRGMPINMR